MLLRIPQVLTPDQVMTCRDALNSAEWIDGGVTAGHQSGQVKRNMQMPQSSPVAKKLGAMILDALDSNPSFTSAALPAKVYPPLFNSYSGGQSFGNHVDNAIRQLPGTTHRVRTDISATLFLSAPDEYDGGELIIDDTYGPQSVKLPAGDMVLYPGTSLHRVTPVTRGARVSSFFWIQSLVREDAQRSILFDMDMAIVRLNQKLQQDENLVALTGVYHNLLRRWSDI